MGDDAATVEQLRAELRQARSEADSWRDEAARRDRRLAEALEQQAAQSAVMRALAASSADVQGAAALGGPSRPAGASPQAPQIIAAGMGGRQQSQAAGL